LEVNEVGSIVDGSVVRAHQDASGGKGGSSAMPSAVLAEFFDQTPGRRRHERPLHLRRDHAGQRHEMMKADELLANAPGKAFIADAGYDSNRFRQAIRDKRKRAVIGSRPRAIAQAAEISRSVQQALSRRVLLPQLEALSGHRHPLREDGAELPRTTQVARAWLWFASN
jgi:transposase